ncbi:Serine/threonine-protein kinase sty17 [Bulinus truncatus]|nr:Serine/threonine-protein kinase sty17 [Bulinus truncatus]
MPNVYVDNDLNRGLGRVGLQHGTAVHGRGGGSRQNSGSQGRHSNRGTINDNNSTNSNNLSVRSTSGRVGDSRQSTSHSKTPSSHSATECKRVEGIQSHSAQFDVINRSKSNSGSTTPSSSGQLNVINGSSSKSGGSKLYADNPYNRSLGRVGLEHGTAVHHGTAVQHNSQSDSSGYASSSAVTVDRSTDRKSDKSRSDHTSATQRKSDKTSGSSSKTDVYDEQNHQLSGASHSHGSSREHRTDSGRQKSTNSNSDTKTYVDNEHNRQLGRVGLPYGSAPEHRTDSDKQRSSKSMSDTKRYVNNEQNRKLGRAGLPYGSVSEQRPNSSQQRSEVAITQKFEAMALGDQRVYKDNSLNRKLGRVGKPLGYKKNKRKKKAHSVYVDNDYNRRYNRVGKPLGSVPIPVREKTYRDNPLNRQLGRVGLPWGTCKGKQQSDLMHKLKGYNFDDEFPDEIIAKYEQDPSAKIIIVQFIEMANREKNIRKFLEEVKQSIWDPHHHTSKKLARKYKGNVIKCQDLIKKKPIGHGSFGEVFMAVWEQGEVLAIKVLKNGAVSKRKQQMFEDEILLYCTLEHDNIVQFIGACNELAHLAIVMEYMDLSLHQAIHEMHTDFSEEERLIIMKDIANGLEYLHSENISHCDLKPGNVMLNNIPGLETTDPQMPVIAKLSDFGLSMLRSDPGSSSLTVEKVKNAGTLRYSAPEVLRGELLDVGQMMKADIYSLGLTALELLLEGQPFGDLDRSEVKRKVGTEMLKPRLANEHILDGRLKNFLDQCFSFSPKDRPNAESSAKFFSRCRRAYL